MNLQKKIVKEYSLYVKNKVISGGIQLMKDYVIRATGANGGGRPNFAQGGVKDASKLDEILVKIEDELKSIKV